MTKTKLGSGNFGKVFLAVSKTDPDLKVAIKVIKKNNVTHSVD